MALKGRQRRFERAPAIAALLRAAKRIVAVDVPSVIAEFVAFAGPAFLEVMIDPDAGVYPMVGPGQSYEEMITGEFIPSRHKVDIKAPDPSEMF